MSRSFTVIGAVPTVVDCPKTHQRQWHLHYRMTYVLVFRHLSAVSAAAASVISPYSGSCCSEPKAQTPNSIPSICCGSVVQQIVQQISTSWYSTIHDLPLNHVTNCVIVLRRKLFIFTVASKPPKVVGLTTGAYREEPCASETQSHKFANLFIL